MTKLMYKLHRATWYPGDHGLLVGKAKSMMLMATLMWLDNCPTQPQCNY